MKDESILNNIIQTPDPIEEHKDFVNNQEVPLQGIVYRGIVVDNIDPLGLGRVKVIIDGISMMQVSKETAKWAWTMNTFGGGQQDNSRQRYGATFPHPLGSKVFVVFEHSPEPFSNPIIIGGWYQTEKLPLQEYDRQHPGENIPRAWGYVSPKGHSIHCREEDEEESIELISFKKRKIIISDKVDNELITLLGAKGGEITLQEGASGTIITAITPSGNHITINDNEGTIEIKANTKISLTAPEIELHGTTKTFPS